MVLRESALSYHAAEETLPLRDAFAVRFFVSVGMLFDPSIVLKQPLQVLAVVAITVFGKSLAAFLLVLAFRYPLNTALIVSASLAQVGEFSFILAGPGVMRGVLPAEGQSLILAGALISIALTPLVFTVIEPAQTWIRARSKLARKLEQRDDPPNCPPTSRRTRSPATSYWGDTAASAVISRKHSMPRASPMWLPNSSARKWKNRVPAAFTPLSGTPPNRPS